MMPGASNAFLTARATRCVVRTVAARSSAGRSNRFSAACFGITSVCPSACGITSMNASVRSSSQTLCAGISPRRIRAKTLFVSYAMVRPVAGRGDDRGIEYSGGPGVAGRAYDQSLLAEHPLDERGLDGLAGALGGLRVVEDYDGHEGLAARGAHVTRKRRDVRQRA